MRLAVLPLLAALALPGLLPQPAAGTPTGDGSDHPAAPADGHTREEPAVAVSPRDARRVVTAANTLEGTYYVGVNTSHDGGRTYVPHRLPSASGASSQADPNLSFDGRGRLYAGYLSYRPADWSVGGVVVARSDNGGDAWPTRAVVVSANVAAPDACQFQDFPGLAADPRRGHPEVYVAWQRLYRTGSHCATPAGTPTIMLSASRDGGRTWSRPRTVVRAAETGFYLPTVTVARDGAVAVTVVGYASSGTTAAGTDATVACPSDSAPLRSFVVLSTDGGQHFSSAPAQSFCSPGTPVPVGDPVTGAYLSSTTGATYRLPANTNTVKDPRTGRWVNVAGAQDPVTGQQRVAVATSADGRRWTPGGVVAGAPAENQQFPRIAVGPDGHLSLLYLAQLPGGLLQASHSVSTDDGVTWSPAQRLASVPARILAPTWLGFIGDYLGDAVGPDGTAHPVWTDLRADPQSPQTAASAGGAIYTRAVGI